MLGLDLTGSEARPTAAVGLDGGLGLAFIGFLGSDAQILQAIASLNPRLVAIDAPLSLPPGLDCLEENHSCRARGLRSAELALRQRGLGLFYTTKKTIIKSLVYRGIRLQGLIQGVGPQILEVYPYGSKVFLWGKPVPKKTTLEGLAWHRERIGALLPCLLPHLSGLSHDLVDAALAAYTGYLYTQGKAELVGKREEGQICLPLSPPGKKEG